MVLRRLNEWKTAIAEREQVGQMLQHLGMVTEQTCEGIIVVDLKGILHFVNTTWAKMHGYETGNELLGKQINMFYNADQMKNKVIPLSEQAKRGDLSEGTVKHVRKDGTTFHTKVKMIPLADEQGNTNGLMVFVTDIAEYKQLENTLKETTEQAERLKKQVEQLQCETNEHKQAEECLKQQAAELTAANGELQHKIEEFRQAEGELKKCREQLEQRLAEQTAELKAANEQLKQEITQRQQAKEHLRQQVAELTAANEQLQQQITKSKQAQKTPGQSGDQAGESEEQNRPINVQELKEIADLAKRLE